jgi:hypothetical protein
MKAIQTFLICSLCLFFMNAQGQNWWKNNINGEGDLVKKELKIDQFSGVSLGFSGNIILTQGNTQKVVVEGQQNIIDNIKREVKDGTWKVNYEKNVRKAKPVTVYITMPTLDYAAVSGSGNLTSDGHFRNLDNLKVKISGSGDIELSVDARDVTSSISGSGGIRLEGEAASNEVHISGSGDIYASSLKVKDCTISISGSGNCRVKVDGNLDVRISGSGDVSYTGDCNIKSRISGSGDVRSM